LTGLDATKEGLKRGINLFHDTLCGLAEHLHRVGKHSAIAFCRLFEVSQLYVAAFDLIGVFTFGQCHVIQVAGAR